jgi:cyanate lyase
MPNAITSQRSRKSIAELAIWKHDNNGIIRKIAERTGVSHVYVSDILNRRRDANTDKGRAVRCALAEAGAPGFVEQTTAA